MLADLLLVLAAVVIGRKIPTLINAIAITWMAGIVAHLATLMFREPTISAYYHLVPRLVLGVLAVCIVHFVPRDSGTA